MTKSPSGWRWCYTSYPRKTGMRVEKLVEKKIAKIALKWKEENKK
jgi:hypothetical protein